MELFFLCSLIIFTLIISISAGYLFHLNNSPLLKSFHANLPPGRLGLPYIGETLDILKNAGKGYPEKFITERITKYSSKIFKTSIVGEPTIVFCGAEGNKFLFSLDNKLVSSWWPSSVGKIFTGSYTQIYSHVEILRMKTMLPHFVKPEALMKYVGTMDSIARKHFNAYWEGKQQVVVSQLAKYYTFAIASKVFLSIEDIDEVAKLGDPFDILMSGLYSVPINFPGTTFSRALKASNGIRKHMRAIIEQRKIDLEENKASPTQDILSHMLLATDENGQHVDGLRIAETILGLLVGGYDTASCVISCIIKYLSDFPHIYDHVFKEQMEIVKSKNPGEFLNWEDLRKMKYSWNVACEVMRIDPPGFGGFKDVKEDFTFNGFTIPKGWKVYWTACSTHRNPKCFPEPEKFDPTRFEGNGPAPYTYVPFGGGTKMCPGREFARLEILVLMHNLVKRFKWEKIIFHEKVIMTPLAIPAKGHPIRLIPHQA